jgi:hypothetical protein
MDYIADDAVLAVYYNSRGEALQQERMTPDILGARRIEAVPIPDAPDVEEGGTGGCPGRQWPCPKAGGGMGCCGQV